MAVPREDGHIEKITMKTGTLQLRQFPKKVDRQKTFMETRTLSHWQIPEKVDRLETPTMITRTLKLW